MTAGPAHGSSAITLASLVSRERNILFITAHGEDADEAFAMLEEIGTNVALFPALEFDTATELVASRLALLERLGRGDFQGVVVASITSIMQMSPAIGAINSIVKKLNPQMCCDLSALQQWLVDAGYERRKLT